MEFAIWLRDTYSYFAAFAYGFRMDWYFFPFLILACFFSECKQTPADGNSELFFLCVCAFIVGDCRFVSEIVLAHLRHVDFETFSDCIAMILQYFTCWSFIKRRNLHVPIWVLALMNAAVSSKYYKRIESGRSAHWTRTSKKNVFDTLPCRCYEYTHKSSHANTHMNLLFVHRQGSVPSPKCAFPFSLLKYCCEFPVLSFTAW